MRATDRDEQLKSACAAMEDGAATARTLASSVGAEERLGLARAVVFRVVSRFWKAAAAADESRRWPLREPSDLGLGACPPEAEELSERVGKAAATENHLNMIKPGNGAPKVAPAALAVVLNSEFVDRRQRAGKDLALVR